MKLNQEIIHRVKAPTPKFFKTVRRIAITLGAVGTALLTAPVALPAAITTVAGYLVAAGLVATAVSSAAVADGAGATGALQHGTADGPPEGAGANPEPAVERKSGESTDRGASGKEGTP